MERPRVQMYEAADRTHIAWAMHGSGYPLVRVGTFMTHLLLDWEIPVWKHWLTDFGSRFTYIRYDERGCGLSSRHPAEITVDAWLSDLDGVINSTGFDEVALIGTSHGTALAIAYAAANPSRVSHLISLGGFAVGGSAPDATADQLEQSRVFKEAVRVFWEDPNQFLTAAFSRNLVPDADDTALAAIEELMRQSSTGEVAAAVFAERDRMDVRAAAAGLQVPTLIAHARNDRVVPFENAIELAGLVPDASLLALDSANHVLLPGPAWDRFLAEVTRFVGVTRRRAPAATSLSERERDVVALVAQGLSNDEIAERLALSTRTVERHLSNVYLKLGVSGRSARAAAAAQFQGL